MPSVMDRSLQIGPRILPALPAWRPTPDTGDLSGGHTVELHGLGVEGQCEDNAWGWRFDCHIYADDVRDIPIGDGVANVAITGVLVHAPRQPTGK